MTFYIDLPEEEGLRRKKMQKKLDRLEKESVDFHHMVSEGFRKIFSDRPEVVKIDGMMSVEQIQQLIRDEIHDMLD